MSTAVLCIIMLTFTEQNNKENTLTYQVTWSNLFSLFMSVAKGGKKHHLKVLVWEKLCKPYLTQIHTLKCQLKLHNTQLKGLF